MQKLRHIYGNLYWGDCSDSKNEQHLQQMGIENILTVGHQKEAMNLDGFIYQTIDIPHEDFDEDFDYFQNFQNANKFISHGNTLVAWVDDREKSALIVIAYLVQHEHFTLKKATDLLLQKNLIFQSLKGHYQQRLQEYQDQVNTIFEGQAEREKEIFDRQINIQDWDQTKVKNQVVLILGCGGLGTAVLMQLLRLGVGKIILVDRDVVDIHNLPRQMMFGLNDVGSSKIEAAIKNCQIHNISDTIIEGHHLDALKHWNSIVEMAKESTFVFNLIDHGDYWDLAVQSLCLKLKLPHVSGGNYANSIMTDLYKPEGQPCYLCLTPDLKEKQIIDKLHPNNIMNLIDISDIPPNNNPSTQSYAMLCTTNGTFLANLFKTYLFTKPQDVKSRRSMFYLDNMETVNFEIEKNSDCKICSKPKVPLCTVQNESTVVKTKLKELWDNIRFFKFETLFPKYVQKTEYISGEPGLLNSIVKVTFNDNKTQNIRLREISVSNYRIRWEVIESEPEMKVTSIDNAINLKSVSVKNWTYINWTTEFSSDLTPEILEEWKIHKLDNFANLRQQYEI